MTHPCLGIPEILRLICNEIQASDNALPTLNALARTCKDLSGPPLDVLWYHMDDMEALIETIPEDLWDDDDDGVFFTRESQPNDFERFRMYSSRVASFGRIEPWEFSMLEDFEMPVAFGPRAATEMVIHDRISPFFPRLRKVHWDVRRYEFGRQDLNLFLRPTLNTLSIAFGCPGDDDDEAQSVVALTMMQGSVRTFSSLTRLDLSMYKNHNYLDNEPPECSVDMVMAISSLVTGLTTVEQLVVPNLTGLGLLNVSKMPELRVLELHNANADSFARLSSQDSVYAFVSLKETIVRVSELEDAYPFIRALKHTCLTTFGLFPVEQAAPGRWTSLIKLVTDNLDRKLLNLFLVGPLISKLAAHLPSKSISPLRKFNELTTFSLRIDSRPDIDDGNLRKLARSWKRLEVLRLAPRLTSNDLSGFRVTADSLLMLAKECKDLEELELCFDASTVPARSTRRPGNGVSNSHLRTIRVYDSKIDDAGAVASFLSDLFPRAKLSGIGPEWEAASTLMVEFQAVRQQERSWRRRGGVHSDNE